MDASSVITIEVLSRFVSALMNEQEVLKEALIH
jgi:hypothetical protein